MTTIKTILSPNPEVFIPDVVQNERQELMWQQYQQGKLVISTPLGYTSIQELSMEEVNKKLKFHTFVRSLYENKRVAYNDDNDFALFIFQEEVRRRA